MLPRWSLETIYPSLDSSEFQNEFITIDNLVEKLNKELSDNSTNFNDILTTYQNLIDVGSTISSYSYAILSTNTKDVKALNALNRVEKAMLAVSDLQVKFLNYLKNDKERALKEVDEKYHYILNLMCEQQQHLMSEAEESLASDLSRSGASAWSRLQDTISSNATSQWSEDQIKTVIQLRSLAFDQDRKVREKAYKAELEVWKQHEIALGAALNGVKGASITLNQRRKHKNAVELSTKLQRIDSETLDSLISSIEKYLPVFRKYLKAKAHHLKVEKLAFYDLFAPIGKSETKYPYSEAQQFIVEHFSSFHKPMGEFAQMAFDKSWIDSEPREGKVGGAYCTSFPLRKESRILANYDYSFDGIVTIAHELGHAYHDHMTNDLPALLGQYPMTLAETASIFSQFVIFKGALENAEDSEKLVLIESFLQDSTQTCVDILSRYYFEKELFEKREKGELTPTQLNELMIKAQKNSYGEGLDESLLHPYMWAVKSHYYIEELPFYNYPYAFGLLFGLGVYNLKEEHQGDFGLLYDKLLELTGQNSVNEVTKSVGFDVSKKEFWEKSLDLVASYVDEFANLVGYNE